MEFNAGIVDQLVPLFVERYAPFVVPAKV